MTLRKFIVLISSLLFLHSPVALSVENRGIKLHVERLALVIGNSAYQTAPLKNPLNDAEDMAATLRNLGFEVVLKKNADQRTMEDTIRYFGKQLMLAAVIHFQGTFGPVKEDWQEWMLLKALLSHMLQPLVMLLLMVLKGMEFLQNI